MKPKIDISQFIGPKIVGDNGHFLRVIDDIVDAKWFAETMRDWPKDQEGYFVAHRCRAVCSKHFIDSKKFQYPLTAESRYNFTMVYCLEDGTQVGYRRSKAMGTTHHIAQQAIHPSYRSQGYSRAMMAPWMLLARQVQQAEITSLEILEDNGPGLIHMTEGYKTTNTGTRVGTTGQNVIGYAVTMEMYESYIASTASKQDKEVLWHFIDPEHPDISITTASVNGAI